MKGLANTLLVIAGLSVVIGLISRVSMRPMGGVESHAIFEFAQTLLLGVIALVLIKK